MSNNQKSMMTLAEIASRWRVHRSTASRILSRFGMQAQKFGRAKSSSVRYDESDILTVERIARNHLALIGQVLKKETLS